jgi:hypothetical protein
MKDIHMKDIHMKDDPFLNDPQDNLHEINQLDDICLENYRVIGQFACQGSLSQPNPVVTYRASPLQQRGQL